MKLLDFLIGLLPAALRPFALQFLTYLSVSAVALVVDVSVYWMLLGPLRLAAFAAAGGFIAGASTHYAISSRLAFADQLRARGVAAEAPVVAKFFAAGCTGLIVTALTVGLLADWMGVHPLLAKFAAAGLSFFCVFTAMRLFVFDALGSSHKAS